MDWIGGSNVDIDLTKRKRKLMGIMEQHAEVHQPARTSCFKNNRQNSLMGGFN